MLLPLRMMIMTSAVAVVGVVKIVGSTGMTWSSIAVLVVLMLVLLQMLMVLVVLWVLLVLLVVLLVQWWERWMWWWLDRRVVMRVIPNIGFLSRKPLSNLPMFDMCFSWRLATTTATAVRRHHGGCQLTHRR
jgi:hypothetical protein